MLKIVPKPRRQLSDTSPETGAHSTATRPGYALNWETAEQRVKDHKAFLLDAPQKMDPQRLEFLMQVYDEYKGESNVMLRARLLERVLTRKDIFLDGNPVVGTMTGIRAGVYPYPEWQVNWIKDEIDMVKMSSLGEVSIPQETQDLLKKVYKQWKGNTTYDRANRIYKEIYKENAELLVKSGWIYPVNDNSTGSGACNYQKVINVGIAGILEEVEGYIAALPKKATNVGKLEFYRATQIALKAVVAYAHRYADLAEATAQEEADPKVKAELLEIAEVCRRVPEFPARNFREAIQAFWFTHLCVEIEQAGCGTSPGRYGQYMYPLYRKDIDEGLLTREQALTLLKFQWVKHLEVAVYQGAAYTLALSGHTGQVISIGGLTAEGEDASTELEEVIMDCQMAMKNIQPTLALFYHPKMKESYLRKAVDVIRTGVGQPQFMNNGVVVQRHLSRFGTRGITLGEARKNCVVFGCVGTGQAGQGSYVTFEGQPNLAKLVEFTLNDGYDAYIKKQISVKVGDPRTFQTFDEFYEAFRQHAKYCLMLQRRITDLGNSTREELVPSIFRSSVIEGCLEKGLYEEQGGPKYAQSLCITTSGIDAANSLYAIKHLVYDTRKLSMERLLEALAANFEGYEEERKLCFEAPKHGNDYPDVDQLVRRMYRDIEETYRASGTDYFDYEPRMDAFSLSFHNYFAPMTGALPNGRRRGEPMTDASVSAMPGTDVNGVTALLKSAAQAIDTVRFNANHLNVKLLPSFLEGPAGTRTLLSLVRTYFDLGGSHIQFNCVDTNVLREAQKNPQNYKDLVVRVAGFSAYFTRLDIGVQNEIIKRTQYVSAS
ncbi:glycyl radical enzyme [Betaproteobacteria bacterium]|nr:glycyl radical enzyme [Betaproteobacteria bacterium]GHU24859.1 glycyl radical enzyme [Betaproteobacteria bacterium]GHU28230.1 glycyl radical enzyme [Betaproteobacteria bacterium]